MKHVLLLLAAVLLGAGNVPAVPGRDANAEMMLFSSYLELLVSSQAGSEAGNLAADLDGPTASEVRNAAKRYEDQKRLEIREQLSGYFSGQARALFQDFVTAFSQAESSGDASYLSEFCGKAGVLGVSTYPELREQVMETIPAAVQSAADFLGKVQTWVSMKQEGKASMSLEQFLNPPKSWSFASVAKAAPREARDPLAGAEEPLPEWTGQEEEQGNPMDAFSSARFERREKILADAQAGMEQVAAERRAAEEEYAAKRAAEAEAEAAARTRFAEQLAAVDQEALEQRKNSWGNRLKRIVGATISATSGAFLGAVGQRAADEAVGAVFGD